jgi:phenylpropionate dioxygenase-like ring-hydroxylating dioxygenase large terminal subunit
MFIHDSHLPQVLTPSQYTSQAQYLRELETLFQPSWHIVGTTADLPQTGDFLTIELFGYPLVVWNAGDGIKTFLNVCENRLSLILSDARGHTGNRLQYREDGWEFDESGMVTEGSALGSEKPASGGRVRLHEFSTELCGQLIFVNLSENPVGLQEFLGPGYEVGEELCSPKLRFNFMLEILVDANWKTKIENSLESYHLEMVHPKTFGKASAAEDSYHELQPGWTTYETPDEAPTPLLRLLDRLMDRLVSIDIEKSYKHYLYYPHIMFGKMRLFSWAEMIVPMSANQMRIQTYLFCYRGRDRLSSKALVMALRAWQKQFFTKIAYEDVAILTEVQRGMSAPMQPSTGVVSIREERCFHFQEYVRQATDAGSSDDAKAA